MATAGAKVTVACKIGVPYFDLQLCEMQEVQENTQTGPRTIKQWVRVGDVVRVRGTAYPRGTPPEGFPAKPQMFNGFALTHGVSKDFWDAWVKQQAKAPYVISGMITAHESIEHVRGHAKERVGQLSGLEPLRPDKDARVPRSTNASISAVETEDSRKAKVAMAAMEDAT
jgi:hypothetical protein